MDASSFFVMTTSVLITSWISGVFGLGGGLILMFVLFQYLDTSTALVVHALLGVFVSVHRAVLLRSDINQKILWGYGIGLLIPFTALFNFPVTVESRNILLLLGVTSIFVPLLKTVPIDIRKTPFAVLSGIIIGSLSFGVGASGPLFNVFFLNKDLNKEEVMATKSALSILGLLLKIIFFWRLSEVEIGTQIGWLLPVFLFHGFLGTQWAEQSRSKISESWFLLSGRFITAAMGFVLIALNWP